MADKLIKTLNFGTGDTYHLAPEWDNIQNKPEDIGGGGGTADSVEWDNVKNKPFGIDYDNPTVLVDNQTFEYDATANGYPLGSNIALKVGTLYSVNYNGIKYELEARLMYGFAYIGNPVVFGETDNGVPFIIITISGNTKMMDVNGSTEPITLTLHEFEIKKIDAEYLQAMKMYYVSASDDYVYVDATLTTKLTCEELSEDMKKYALAVTTLSSGTPISVSAVLFAEAVPSINEYGRVAIVMAFGNSPVHGVYYTAEYTEPTATEV